MKNMVRLSLSLTGFLLALLFLVGQVGVANASASAPLMKGQWKLTGSMHVARYNETATRLANGKVLVAGGEYINDGGGYTALASAEVYDPGTGQWSQTGSMSVARVYHLATLLSNGQVLVAGGQDSNGNALASAELYNPGTGKWSKTSSMMWDCFDFSMTRLSNGQVLVAGGEGVHGTIAQAELYHPGTGLWSATGSMNAYRMGQTATLLSNGQVLIAGGKSDYPTHNLYASAELYNPSTGVWSMTGSMHAARVFHQAVLLNTGQVLVAGGASQVERYNPGNGTWSLTGSLNLDRSEFSMTRLSNGQVLVAGGETVHGTTSDAELYTPGTGTWSVTGKMNNARKDQTATLLSNGQVLIAGGMMDYPMHETYASAELFS